MKKNKKILIVGAGFAGSTCARELADSGFFVTLIDKRSHIGGNAFDEFDSAGLLIHKYGPHIFHTNSERIFNWLSKFTAWRIYEHEVLAYVNDKYLPIPINQNTINQLYQLNLDEQGIQNYLSHIRVAKTELKTSADVVLNSVGEDLCNKFFRGYTKKQWGLDLEELSAGVAARIPTRTNTDNRYFTDTYQVMPLKGYTALFKEILDSSNISLQLNTDFSRFEKSDYDHIIYTGPIDAYFNYCYGKLPYRSLNFKHEYIPNTEFHQQKGTINYPNDFDFTRITEFKYLTGQVHTGTSIVREYPQAEGEPYYPIPRAENETLYQQYKKLAEQETCTTFVGRLAQYRYYNMDQVVGSALKASQEVIAQLNDN